MLRLVLGEQETLEDFLNLPEAQKIIKEIKKNEELLEKFNNVPSREKIACLQTAMGWCQQSDDEGDNNKDFSILKRAIEIFIFESKKGE